MIDPNQAPLDVYTLFHVGTGALMEDLGLSFSQAVLASVVFEWWIEPVYKDRYPEIFPVPSQDSVANRVMDTVAVAAGWALSKRAKRS